MSDMSRRAFLRTGVALAAVTTPLGLSEEALAATHHTARGLTRSAFLPHVGSTFQVSGSGRSFTAVLGGVRDLAAAPAGDEQRFSLLFTMRPSSLSTVAPQGTYRFGRPGLGRVELFVSPVDRGVRTRYHEAVVNRLH